LLDIFAVNQAQVISKLIFYLLLSMLSGVLTQAQRRTSDYQVSAIAFYNCENFFDTLNDPFKADDDFTPEGNYHYTAAIYQAKVHNLATVLQQLGSPITSDGPALIGTAEIENDQVLHDLVKSPEIKDRNYQFVHFDSPDPRGIDVALIYNPRYFKVMKAEALPTDISKYAEKGGKTRDVLHVIGLLAGDTIHVFVNHWPSRRGGQAASNPLRAIAASISKRVIDSLMHQNPGTRVIEMGDLNDDPTDPSVIKVLQAKGARDQVLPGGLYNPFTAYILKGIGTLAFNDAWNLFDQIMVSSGLLNGDQGYWKFYKSEIFSRDFLKEHSGQYRGYPRRSFDGTTWNNGFSDHFPVLVYLIRQIQKKS